MRPVTHCASRLIQNGLSLYEVASILGHRDVQTTQRYAHLEGRGVSQRARDILEALNRMPDSASAFQARIVPVADDAAQTKKAYFGGDFRFHMVLLWACYGVKKIILRNQSCYFLHYSLLCGSWAIGADQSSQFGV